VIAAGVRVDATPGSSAELELDGGDGAVKVLTGKVEALERRHDGTVVSLIDGAGALAALRPHETYSGMLAMQIITELCGLADVDTGIVVATIQTASYVADPRRTAAEHIAVLADHSGGVAAIDGNGSLSVMTWPIGVPTAAMRLDREFIAISTSSQRLAHERAIVGSGGAGVALAPDAWLMSVDALTHADRPAPERSWRAAPLLRTGTDVDLANRSASTQRAAASRRVRGECWLQPARRPGDVVQIQQTAHHDQAGPWLITGIQHELAWDCARTRISGVAGGDTSSLAGAIGGLL
jgi:hypothetical protein